MLKKILFLIMSLAILLTGILVSVNNGEAVSFDYYFASVSLPLIALLFIAMTIGALLSLVLCSVWVFKQHRQLKRSEQSKAMVQKELDNLRKLRGEG